MQPGLRGKSVRNSPVNSKVREEQGEDTLQQRFLCSLWRTPQWSRWVFPEGAKAHGEANAEARERCEKEGAAERNGYELTPAPHSPSPLCHWGWERDEKEVGVKLRL